MATPYNSNFAYNSTGRIYNDAGAIPSTPGIAKFRSMATTMMANRNRTSATATSRARTSTTMKPR